MVEEPKPSSFLDLDRGEQLRLMVQSVEDYAIFMLDREGRIATWNIGAERIKGYRADEIIGRHFSCFYTQEDVLSTKPHRALETVLSEGKFEDEGWRIRKDGTRFWASVVIAALRDETGLHHGFIKVTRDLTERKLAEQQRLRLESERLARLQSEEQFHRMVDSVQDYAIITLDPNGIVSTWNLGARRIKGYQAEEIIGQHFSVFYPAEDVEARKPWRILGMASTEGRFEDEGWRLRKDGTKFWGNVVITAFRDETGALLGYTKVTRDLTERKQAEAARIKLQAEQIAREQAEASNRRLAFLADASQLLSQSLDYGENIVKVAQLGVPLLADWFVIYLVNGEQSIDIVADIAIESDGLKRGQEILRRYPFDPSVPDKLWSVLRTGKAEFHPVISDDLLSSVAPSDEVFEQLRSIGFSSGMIIPIVARGEILGAIQLACIGGRRFDQVDLTMAQEVARHLALALENGRLYRETQDAYRQLEESYAQTEAFLNSAPGLAFFDHELRYIRVNEALAIINNLPAKQHIGRTFREVVPALANELEPMFRRVLDTGEPLINAEIKEGARKGLEGQRYWLLNVSPVQTPRHRVIGLCVAITDITDRKKMEEALRESQELLAGQKAILEAIAEGATVENVMHQIAQFIEAWCPDTLCAIHRMDANGMFLRCVSAMSLHEDDRQALQSVPVSPLSAPCGAAAYSREAVIISGDEPPAEHVNWGGLPRACWAVPVIGRQREVVGTLTLYYRPVRPPGSHDHKLISISTNLIAIAVERAKAEESRDLKLRKLVEHMGEGVIAIDRLGRVLVANSSAYELLQITSPIEGVLVDNVQLPSELRDGINRVSHPDSPPTLDLVFRSGQIDIGTYLSRVATDFGQYGTLLLLRDVTLEQQLRRLQSSFVANVSHEIRGPLASVSAVAQALRDEVIPQTVRAKYHNALVGEMERLRRLTDQLLTLSKLDAGVVDLAKTEFDLGDMCQVLGELWSFQCAAAGLELQVDCPSIQIKTNYDAVEQVLINLLENAVRFTPQGGTIRLAAACQGSTVVIQVEDTGIGIAPEHSPYVWEPFFKVDQARTLRPDSGAGLGLSTVRRLVEQLGGRVLLESEVGCGTKFRIELPTDG